MRQETLRAGVARHLIIALIVMLCLIPIDSAPVFALSVDEYFSYSYNVEISQTEIQGNETFYATAEGLATCKKNLPLPVSTAHITSRVIAQHQESGAEVILNSNYTMTIEPFPNIKGETSQASVSVPLAFPAGSQSGTYNIIGQLVEAQVYAIVVWVDVTPYLPSSEAAGSITYSAAGGGGSGATPPAVPGPVAGVTDVSDLVNSKGTFSETVVAQSFDGKVKVTIRQNTTGLTEDGEPLSEIAIIEVETPPPPPVDANYIGLVYDFGPGRVSFDQPVSISLSYDQNEIAADIAEESLVIAVWEEESGQWVPLVSTVDTANNIVTAEVTHFTSYTILAYARPTGFTVSNLTISFRETSDGEEVIIGVLVTNNSDVEDTHEVTLKIDSLAIGTKTETREVALAGGASETVTFVTSPNITGIYAISIDGQSGTFAVNAIPPSPTLAEPPADQSGTSEVVTPEVVVPAKPFNWWLVNGIITACIVFGVLAALVARQKYGRLK